MTNVQETNPLDAATDTAIRSAKPNHSVDWTTDGLVIYRLRLLSEPGTPFFDVSYCYGTLNGENVRVRLPFSQLPKRKMKMALYAEAKLTGKFIKGLFNAVSALN
jgi:hypothetical protein